MLHALICACALAPFDFYSHGPYDSEIPRPEQILGYNVGERHTTFREQENVVSQLSDKASARMKIITYGKSVEGRPLRVIAIGSETNIARLDGLRQDWEKLANPQPGQDTAAITKRTPALVWINECIHGNETASFESAMWLIYTLAASREEKMAKTLDNVVVFVNPVYNPDGHERFVVWYNSVAVGSANPRAFEHAEPGIIHGRTNHYRFDMNRDRVAMSQDETRAEVSEFLNWHPQVYVDQHGQVESYFFPPNPMAVHQDVDRERIAHWTDVFGRGNAAAFDKNGWPYFVRDTFDLFYAGYLDSWATLSGAIGMTYETDGGHNLRVEREDGSILTLRDGVAKHFTSALATIQTAAEHREELLASFAKYRQQATTGELAGKFKRVVVTGTDPRPLMRLSQQLARSGIRSYFSAEPFSHKDAHSYWAEQDKAEDAKFDAGSLVIDIAQPQGLLAKALLEPQPNFEAEFVKQQLEKRKAAPAEEDYPEVEGAEFYDLTGWSLIYGHNLTAWWCESAPSVKEGSVNADVSASIADSSVGWALPYTDRQDALATFELLGKGVKCMIATKDMRLADGKFPRGTFLFMRNRNEDDLKDTLSAVSRERNVRFVPLRSSYPESGREGPGSETVRSLTKPSVAVVFGAGDWSSSFSGVWWLMEKEFHLPFTPITANALNGDLSKYTCIVFPQGRYGPPSDRLKDWVRGGGCAVVLDGVGWALGDKGFFKLDEVKHEKNQPADVPGSIFRARIEPRLFLTYGYPEGKDIAVPLDGSTFYKTKKEGGGAVVFSNAATPKLLSGWEWPDDTEKNLSNVVWLHDQPVGRGHVVIFTQDPTARAMWPGLYKLFLNAMLMGAAQ